MLRWIEMEVVGGTLYCHTLGGWCWLSAPRFSHQKRLSEEAGVCGRRNRGVCACQLVLCHAHASEAVRFEWICAHMRVCMCKHIFSGPHLSSSSTLLNSLNARWCQQEAFVEERERKDKDGKRWSMPNNDYWQVCMHRRIAKGSNREEFLISQPHYIGKGKNHSLLTRWKLKIMIIK